MAASPDVAATDPRLGIGAFVPLTQHLWALNLLKGGSPRYLGVCSRETGGVSPAPRVSHPSKGRNFGHADGCGRR